jgi:hypothetical protein
MLRGVPNLFGCLVRSGIFDSEPAHWGRIASCFFIGCAGPFGPTACSASARLQRLIVSARPVSGEIRENSKGAIYEIYPDDSDRDGTGLHGKREFAFG